MTQHPGADDVDPTTLGPPPEAPDFLEKSSRAYHLLIQVERAVSSLLLVGVFVAVMLQVVTRYVFNNPLVWTEEIARFLLVWLTFVAAGYVASRRLHIVVDLLVAKLGKVGTVIVDSFAVIAVLMVSGALSWAAFTVAQDANHLRAPASDLPLSVLYLAGFVGFGLILLHSALNLYVNLRHPEEIPKPMENIEKEGA